MINFYAVLDNYNVNPNYEIDEYAWVDIEDCEANLAEAKIALQFFKYYQSIREEDYGNF
jgi:NADH pyrophosphatase NudC (nudix superfamily)